MKDQVMIHGVEYVPKVTLPDLVEVGRWKPVEGYRRSIESAEGISELIEFIKRKMHENSKYNLAYPNQTSVFREWSRQLVLAELEEFGTEQALRLSLQDETNDQARPKDG